MVYSRTVAAIWYLTKAGGFIGGSWEDVGYVSKDRLDPPPNGWVFQWFPFEPPKTGGFLKKEAREEFRCPDFQLIQRKRIGGFWMYSVRNPGFNQ